MTQLVLGLDSSTQSISAVVIDIDIDEEKIIHEAALNFSQEFPHYQTEDGVLRGDDATEVHAPPLMWVEALDALFMQLKDAIDLSQVVAIGGSGQQHGSVYLKESVNACLAKLDSSSPLHVQLVDQFSRATSPIWMDASTSAQCEALAADCGGNAALCEATGSVAVERFTGAQIKKFAEQDPQAYQDTAHISLVSSFISSLLVGAIHGIDYGDATGMNLLDIRQRAWHDDAVKSCGAQLSKKLQAAVDPRDFIGNMSKYMQERFGFSADCQVLPFSGDNPCSLVGLGLVEDDMTAISLGTSDTVFGHISSLPETMSQWAHTFVAPTNNYMLLLCFKNGSLAREAIRQQCGFNWDEFTAAIEATDPGNNGGFMLPWFDTEIVPKVLTPGVHIKEIDEQNKAALCRGVVESQMLAMRLHAAEAGLEPTSIRATGGASQNAAILQIMADVFQCPVDVLEISNGAALGAGLRAIQAIKNCDWQTSVAPYTQVQASLRKEPRKQFATVYNNMLVAYTEAEQAALSA